MILCELDRYSIADLVDTSPALAQLALWQPVTWNALAQPGCSAGRHRA